MKLKIHLFIFAHTLSALLIMILYSKYTPLSINAILIHTIAICSAYITLLYCTPRKLLVFSISTLSILLLLLYIGNIVAINYWNDTISWSFLINNVSVLSKELQRFPVYVFAFLLIAIALLIKIYSKLLNLQTDFRRHFGILPIIPILLFLFYYSLYSIQENISSTLQGEPLFEFFNEKQKATITVKAPAAAAPNRIALQKEKNQPNIILIHGDALRADRLSAYGNTRKTTPFIDSLISEMGGVKIENSMSNCSETICGIASVTASRFSYNENTKNIFTILAENGYTNNFIGTGDLYHGRLDQYLNPITYNFLRADLNEKYYKHDDRFIIDTLSSYPPSSQHPQLFYLRMMSSHPLGDHRQKYKRYQPTPNSLFSMATWGKNILEAQINAHDNFASQFDGYVENIFSIMRAKGYLDNAVVVIFGDHGDAMGEHGYQGHYNSIYQEEIHVPIIIWASNNIDMKVNTNSFATLMDIPPTLLHHLKIAIPKSFLGQPLQIDNSEKIAYLDSKRKVAGVLYQSEEKIYKLFISKKDLHPLHLFELESDPGERSDVHKQKKEITKKLADLYSKFINPQLGSEAIQ